MHATVAKFGCSKSHFALADFVQSLCYMPLCYVRSMPTALDQSPVGRHGEYGLRQTTVRKDYDLLEFDF